jgi:LysR family transcriptional regulator for metE and metH
LYDPSYQDTPIIEALIEAQHVKPKTLHRIHYTDATIEMVNAGLGITVMADWIVEPYLKDRNIVVRPLHHSIAKRVWFAATCKQTPAIQNFLECLKMYFSGADMNTEEPVAQQYTGIMQTASPVTRFNAIHDIKNYQY